MNEQPYKVEDLQEYTGILTNNDTRGTFKMELKMADNPVLEKSVEKIEPSIELDFHYNLGTSTLFFHNIHCQKSRQDEGCPECKKIIGIYDKFEANLHQLQIGDTFRIKAALIHNKKSELPVSIQSFKNYERIEVACTEYRLRLPDTPEGINHKYKLEQQRLQREREAEEKRKADEEQAQTDAKRRKRKESIQQYFGKRPNTNQIIITVVGTTIANQVPLIFKGLKYIYHLIFPN